MQEKSILSLDLSSSPSTISLHKKTQGDSLSLLLEARIGEKGDQCEKVLPSLKYLLSETGTSLEEINLLVTSAGPGSFTGLRIGYATLKALAYAKKIPIETVSGHECRALAWAIQYSVTKGEILVLTRVSLNSYAVSQFRAGSDFELSIAEDRVLGFSDTMGLISRFPGTVLIDSIIDKYNNSNWTLFPLSAAAIGNFYEKCKTRKTYQGLLELAMLSPNYAGSTRFE